MKTIIVYMALLYFQQSLSEKYYNYTLYRSIPVDEHQLNFFHNISVKYGVKFWRKPGRLYKPIDIMISPMDQPAVIREAIEYGIGLETILEDVQSAFDQQTVLPYIRRSTESFDWHHYYRIDDIYNWLRDMSEVHSKSMKLMSIGKTSKGRDVMAVTVDIGNWQLHPRTIIMIDGGIHAREWISVAFVTFLIFTILNAPLSHNENLKRIAPMYEWNFVPVLNPDGYEYSHIKDRMWRKNRVGGYGVDLNRNFGYDFGGPDTSWFPLSEVFCGRASFSELETKAMANFVTSKSSRLKFYLSFHSYGQFMIIPYAASTKHLENSNEIRYLAQMTADQIHKIFGTHYSVGTAYDTVGYTASGCSMDWVKNTFQVPYAVTFELPDKGRYGFALPPKYIQSTCDEALAAVISLVDPRTKVNQSTWVQGWQGWKEKQHRLNNCSRRTKLHALLLYFSFIYIIV